MENGKWKYYSDGEHIGKNVKGNPDIIREYSPNGDKLRKIHLHRGTKNPKIIEYFDGKPTQYFDIDGNLIEG